MISVSSFVWPFTQSSSLISCVRMESGVSSSIVHNSKDAGSLSVSLKASSHRISSLLATSSPPPKFQPNLSSLVFEFSGCLPLGSFRPMLLPVKEKKMSGGANLIVVGVSREDPPFPQVGLGPFSRGPFLKDVFQVVFCKSPDFATGVTFASAATGYDNATSDVLSVLPLWKQLEYYKEYQTKLKAYQGKDRATETIENSLYLISIGTNDFLENYFAFPGRSSQYSVSLYQDFLAGIAKDFVKKLHGLGARKISLGGLPPMGCMPLERATNIGTGGECVGRYNDIAVQFNSKLDKMVEKLSKELPGSTLVFSNPYEPFMRIIKNPSSFGFEVVGAACCASGMFEMGYGCQRNNPFTCTNADKYVFWDSFHPTQKTNHIMANALMNSTFPHFL